MKSYTDLEQSKKLAEMLPIESADMEFMFLKKDNSMVSNVPFIKDGHEEPDCSYNIIPCWSLAALLDYLSANFRVDIKYLENHWEFDCRARVAYNKELVDACAEMIIKLNEQKIL